MISIKHLISTWMTSCLRFILCSWLVAVSEALVTIAPLSTYWSMYFEGWAQEYLQLLQHPRWVVNQTSPSAHEHAKIILCMTEWPARWTRAMKSWYGHSVNVLAYKSEPLCGTKEKTIKWSRSPQMPYAPLRITCPLHSRWKSAEMILWKSTCKLLCWTKPFHTFSLLSGKKDTFFLSH